MIFPLSETGGSFGIETNLRSDPNSTLTLSIEAPCTKHFSIFGGRRMFLVWLIRTSYIQEQNCHFVKNLLPTGWHTPRHAARICTFFGYVSEIRRGAQNVQIVIQTTSVGLSIGCFRIIKRKHFYCLTFELDMRYIERTASLGMAGRSAEYHQAKP